MYYFQYNWKSSMHSNGFSQNFNKGTNQSHLETAVNNTMFPLDYVTLETGIIPSPKVEFKEP